ncbi:MAG: hypothetical protein U0571_08085 [Candidatus Brocadia sapporoensis]|nr:hypothetical protein [Candidatus Brocadia sapporoensis]TVL98309.1 MAG: hypothetical protein CV082_00815 [Candidatus Brocadia sp. BL1]
MPKTLGRKHPNAPADWRWQWLFLQEEPVEEHENHRSRNYKKGKLPNLSPLFYHASFGIRL